MADGVPDGSDPSTPIGWPAHRTELRPWRQTLHGGTKEDRMLRDVTVSLPAPIARLEVPCSAATARAMQDALAEIAALDRVRGVDLAGLGSMLLRNESVASSKIESITSTMDDYARALHGNKASAPAAAMVAATEAFDLMMGRVVRAEPITIDLLTDAHRRLMWDDPHERGFAGRIRDMQNWIGGSDHSPRNALYVPPPPDLVSARLDDLMAFSNRVDVPILSQAAVAHAQFESIHPFTDGNGRIGRALMNVILRRRGATTVVVVPIASGLAGNRDRYFAALTAYRDGDPEPMMTDLVTASLAAAQESRTTAERLSTLPARWRDEVGRVRRGSATDQLLATLTTAPIFTVDEAAERIDAPLSGVYAAVERLHTAGVLRSVTPGRRNRVWAAADVLDELDDLGVRIAAATR